MQMKLLAGLISIACALAMPPALAADGSTAGQQPAKHAAHKQRHAAPQAGTPAGHTRKGKASYYARRFAGRTMADGTRFDPQSNVAASRTLPLGTRARVTNLENGKSAVVEIRDRGPYVDGRIVDLTPKTAEALDFKEKGIASVAVTPIELPESAGASDNAGASSSGE
jgi:rare lipoprotein A